jgi:signal transduction histidine kinase
VLRAEENERNKIAKELHDGLAPLLSSAKMLLSAVDKTQVNSANLEVIDKTDNVMLSSIETLKEISNRVSPHILRNFGIVKAIEKYVQNIKINDQIKIKFDTNIEDERFDSDVETVIYRIACELLTNSFKHAKCDTISINTFRYKNQLVLIYADNGIGIDQKKLQKSEGMGLSNIFSRVKSVNGQVKFNTRPINGFWIKIKIPVAWTKSE